MSQNPKADETQDQQGSFIERREFLRLAAVLGLSGGALALFDAACSSVEPLAPLPTLEVPPTKLANPTSLPAASSTTRTAPPVASTPAPSPRPQVRATPPSISNIPATSSLDTQILPTATPAPAPTPRSQTVPLPTNAPEHTASPPQKPLPVVRRVPLSDKHLQIGHLLRRAGFGASPAELTKFASMGVADTVDYLVEYHQVDDSALESRLNELALDLEALGRLQRWALLRMAYTERPLQEKMVLFWHGLLTSAFKRVGKGPYMLNQDHLFREQALGNYDVLLKSVSRDPAMLIWLDSRTNHKKAPNENFSRELMELFSTGPGPYTEKDVRESARSFTGYRLRRKVFEFDPKIHDNLSKTFLNITGYLDGDQIIDILMDHPATGDFICTKLFSFFAYDSPDQTVISRLASIFRSSNFSVRKVVKEILLSPEFYSSKAYRAKIKSPPELVAGAVRSLGVETDGKALNGLTKRMGMDLFNPFDVSGWAGGATWINSTTLLQRINFANRVSTAKSGRFSPDLKTLVQKHKISSAQEGLSYFLLVLLDDNISEEEHKILFSFAQNLDAMEKKGAVRSLDDKLRTLLYLVLASPDYQLA